jgi:hypothetical protein
MALAIKSFTARLAYRDIIQSLAHSGRLGKTVRCPKCGVEYVLYYGERIVEADTTQWLQEELKRICPAHTGWLSSEEVLPVKAEEHRERIERTISILQRELDAIRAAAQAPNNVRERLILSGGQEEAQITELRQELD